MGGAYGFRKDGRNKVTYNHMDSNPRCLGKNFTNFIKSMDIEKLGKICDELLLVLPDDWPRKSQIEEVLAWDSKFGYRSGMTWYTFLSPLQGNFEFMENGFPYMVDSRYLLERNTKCEWAYIVNFDNNSFDIYRKAGSIDGRELIRQLTTEGIEHFHNCVLFEEFSLDNIPENWYHKMEDAERHYWNIGIEIGSVCGKGGE